MSTNRHDDDISVPQPVPVDQASCPWCNRLMLAKDIAPHQRAYASCFIDAPNRKKKFGFFVCKDETFESITQRLLNQRFFAGITWLTYGNRSIVLVDNKTPRAQDLPQDQEVLVWND